MPLVVVVHRLKNFDEWLKVFKADPPPKIGRWRLLRGSDDRNRVHVVGEVKASEAKTVRDWIKSQHMQDVFNRDSPDDCRSAMNIRVFRPYYKTDASSGRLPTTSGIQNGGRVANLAIFAGIWTHSSRRLLVNA